MSLKGADATDSANLDGALAEMLKHKLTGVQFQVLKGMWASWDSRSHTTDEEEAELYKHFANEYALGGAIAQVIHIAEKYDANDLVDKQIKDKIGTALQKMEKNVVDQKSSASFKR